MSTFDGLRNPSRVESKLLCDVLSGFAAFRECQNLLDFQKDFNLFQANTHL